MMNETFDMLLPRIKDSNSKVDYEHMMHTLIKIRKTCACIGTGGSHTVSEYAKDVLNASNDVMSSNLEPRSFLYTNDKNISNICAFSYGGHNYGIDETLKKASTNGINTIVFTADDSALIDKNVNSIINYKGILPKEKSFISIASTFIPMSLLLRYHIGNDDYFYDIIDRIYHESKVYIDNIDINLSDGNVDMITGDYNYAASIALESTMVEAGLGRPIVHEKYSLCHGRTTLPFYQNPSMLIYLVNGRVKEIDNLILDNVSSLYGQVALIKSHYDDPIIGEFDLTMKIMFLLKKIANNLNKDLSVVDYVPQVKKLYRFKGEM